jgi:hypothetical protein
MAKKSLTNEIGFVLNYEQINTDFIIVRFADNSQLMRYDDSPLDILKHRIDGVLSVAYLQGKQFYALFSRQNSATEFQLREGIEPVLRECDPEGKISFKFIKAMRHGKVETIDDRHLMQMLLNAIPNLMREAEEEQLFRNMTGKLMYAINAIPAKKIDGQEPLIKQYETLQMTVKALEFPRLCLKMDVKTFTNIRFQNKTSAVSKEFKDLRFYAIDDETRTMRSVKWAEAKEDRKNIFLLAQFANSRASVPLMDFTNYSEFLKSKCGILEQLKNQVEKYLKPYLIGKGLDFLQPDFINGYEPKNFNAETSKDVKIRLEHFYTKKGLSIVDEIQDDTSRDMVKSIIETLKTVEILRGCSIEQTNELSIGKPNFRIINNKEFYKNQEADIYKNVSSNHLVQHITVDGFKVGKAALKNLLKELYIKQDIQNNQITLFDWTFGRWKFFSKEGDSKEEHYAFLTVENDGSLQFDYYLKDEICNNEIVWELSKHLEKEKAECIIISPEGDINAIIHTEQIVTPDFISIGKTLWSENQDRVFKKTEIENLLAEFLSQNPNFKTDEKVSQFVEKVHKMGDEIEKSKLRGLIIGRDKEAKQNKMGTSFKKQFSLFFQEKTGDTLAVFLKDAQSTDLFPLNINYHYKENEALYYVGETHGKGKSLQSNIVNASNIRKIKVLEGSLVFEKLLATMNVDFVKHGELTVLPFPFKYLREYLSYAKLFTAKTN